MPAAGRSIAPLIAAGVASLLWLVFAATASDPLLGQYPVRPAVEIAAALSTALTFVFGGGILLFAFLPGGLRATALQRTLVYAALTLIASFVVLSHYGWDLRAALTTSAIVTAAIGLAMQPTLSSVISGVVLNMDYRLRVGDWIISAGEAIEIESLGWRNVVGRRSCGRLVVYPNAKLADAEVEFVPAGHAVRTDTTLKVPTAMPPDQIEAIVAALVDDLAELDASQAVSVTPSGFDPGASSTEYRVEYWVRDYRSVAQADKRLRQRLWYGFQRAGLYAPPEPSEQDDQSTPLAWAGRSAVARHIAACQPHLAADAVNMLAESGELLLFARGESIALPIRLKGWSFLLLRGELIEPVAFGNVDLWDQDQQPSVQALARASAERYVASQLSRRIGPYAEYIVWRTSRDAADFDELCLTVALEIPDEAARAGFLKDVRPNWPVTLKPGLIFKPERDVAGLLVPHRQLRAWEEVTLLAICPRLQPSIAVS